MCNAQSCTDMVTCKGYRYVSAETEHVLLSNCIPVYLYKCNNVSKFLSHVFCNSLTLTDQACSTVLFSLNKQKSNNSECAELSFVHGESNGNLKIFLPTKLLQVGPVKLCRFSTHCQIYHSTCATDLLYPQLHTVGTHFFKVLI
jgi:hypothetical protein